ncbi:MAG: hypothetical protein ACRDJ5_00025, partial [Actinomycetota bacterium]
MTTPITDAARKSMKPSRRDLEVTAYHEAGHAFAAYILGRAFTRVSIRADDSTLGRCSFRTPGEWFRPDLRIDGPTRRRLEERMMISLAGPEVESLHTGRYDRDAAQEDIDRAIDHACYMSGDPLEASAYVEWLRIRTVNLLKRPETRPSLEALVARLLAREEVRYRHAKRILD